MSRKGVSWMENGAWGTRLLACWLTSVLCSAVGAAEAPPPPKPERFSVTVRVDFGPAEKPGREEHVTVDEGSTAKEVVSLLFPIQSGEICCNTRELAAIDGVWADPAQNRWWTCRINGSTNIGPFRTELKSGDRVEWVYVEQAQ